MSQYRLWMLGVIVFGGIFLGFQVFEFAHFMEAGLYQRTNLFGSSFYMLTGTHGIHVAVGVLWLIGLLIASYIRPQSSKDAVYVEIAGLYWHFVDIVWIVIFTVVYLVEDRKSTRLNSSHVAISYAVFCLKKKQNI